MQITYSVRMNKYVVFGYVGIALTFSGCAKAEITSRQIATNTAPTIQSQAQNQ